MAAAQTPLGKDPPHQFKGSSSAHLYQMLPSPPASLTTGTSSVFGKDTGLRTQSLDTLWPPHCLSQQLCAPVDWKPSFFYLQNSDHQVSESLLLSLPLLPCSFLVSSLPPPSLFFLPFCYTSFPSSSLSHVHLHKCRPLKTKLIWCWFQATSLSLFFLSHNSKFPMGEETQHSEA